MDVIPFEDGLVKRKDVYSDSVSILRQVGPARLSLSLSQLVDRALARLLVLAPALELRAVADAAAADVVERHLGDELRAARAIHSSSRPASQRLGSPLPRSPVS